MREEGSERKSMSEKERREMEEQEKTSEVWIEESAERHEGASADLLKEEEEKGKTPRVGTDVPSSESKTIINPPSSGGKILKGKEGTAAGARCGITSKPCDRWKIVTSIQDVDIKYILLSTFINTV